MTLVEFFDKDAAENICSSLTKVPERVILIGDKKIAAKHAKRYEAVLRARGFAVEFLFRPVNKNHLPTIVDALLEIISTYDDCVFDLTGGEDLYLVAMGVVFEKQRTQEKQEKQKKQNIQMHRFNISNNTITDVDQDGQTILTEEAPNLTVEEIIRIYGGKIVCEGEARNATKHWDMNEDFKQDIQDMWDVCKYDPGLWNAQISFLAAVVRLAGETDDLKITVPMSCLKDMVCSKDGVFMPNSRVMKELSLYGLLESYACNDEVFSVTFKNLQVKRCLTVEGQALEMIVFLTALEAAEEDGTKIYNDVMNGVCIDWDGELGTEQNSVDTENEIDVIMMHGMVPVFVSCKNGAVDKNELYKLNAVATRFGGKYVKKVLIATSLDNSESADYFRQRAIDMNIHLVEGEKKNNVFTPFAELNKDAIDRVIRSLWSTSN